MAVAQNDCRQCRAVINTSITGTDSNDSFQEKDMCKFVAYMDYRLWLTFDAESRTVQPLKGPQHVSK